jgi:hypothetical protein
MARKVIWAYAADNTPPLLIAKECVLIPNYDCLTQFHIRQGDSP